MGQQPSMKKKDSEKAESGFTLIEVVIALAIFSIGILAVFSLHISSIGGNAVARGVTENVTAAAAKVEELMATDYEDLALAPGTQGPFPVDGSDYLSIQWTVNDNCLGGLDLGDHKCVTVTVSSTVNGGQEKEINLDFLKIPLDTDT